MISETSIKAVSISSTSFGGSNLGQSQGDRNWDSVTVKRVRACAENASRKVIK